MQKIVIIASLLCVTAFATAGTAAAPIAVAAGTGDGFLVTTGIVQKCHITCKTCTGFTATTCASCTAPLVLQADKSCSCGTTEIQFATTATMTCAAASTTASDATKCQSGTNYFFDTNKCTLCNSACRMCTAGAAANCKQDGGAAATKGCWGATALAGDGACVYTAAKAYLAFSDKEFDQTSVTASAALGYRYDAATFTYVACAVGCKTCTATAGEECKTCADNFTVNAGKTACECAAGSFSTAATATAVDTCTKCPTGCTTCTSLTVCTACDSSTHVMGTSTTDSSTCLSLSSTDASTTASTTDGEKDGESTSATATDATSTNGVLLTAASMLLAVILA